MRTAPTANPIQRDVGELVDRPDEPPDRLQLTAEVLRTLRVLGWTLAEHRSAGWLYLVARGYEQSVVYKLVGPRFDDAGNRYEGYRIA